MRVAEHIDALREHGRALADAARDLDPATPVPTCPEWRVRDLVRHQGGVHRWATSYVAEARPTSDGDDGDLERLVGGWPRDDDLIGWFREGHASLVAALEAAPDDLICWTFLRAPSARAFWARRQAHETAVHLADARSAGETPTAFP